MPKVKLFLLSFQIPKKHKFGRVKTVHSHQHFILQLLLVIAAFIWQARAGCYGNGVIDVEEKPKVLKQFWQRRSRVIQNNCDWEHESAREGQSASAISRKANSRCVFFTCSFKPLIFKVGDPWYLTWIDNFLLNTRQHNL